MTSRSVPLTGAAAGVPYLAVPPDSGPRPESPVVIGWHLLDPPRTEAAFAAALPLAGLDAWRIYLGLPMSGARLPAGGAEELMRLAFDDAVLHLHGPISDQAVAEFPAAFAELRTRLGLGDSPVGLLGGSAGAGVAARVVAEVDIPVDAVVLVSPMLVLRDAVESLSELYDMSYHWSPESDGVAERLDLVARADEVAANGEPAVLLVVGEDDIEGFRVPAQRLRDALAGRYADPARARFVLVPGMGHGLAEEPGIEPAPQTPSAAVVDRLAVAWFRQHRGRGH